MVVSSIDRLIFWCNYNPNLLQSSKIHRGFEHGELIETSPKSRRKEPILVRYIRRHHEHEQVIGDHIGGIMTRKKLKGTCFLSEFEPRNIKDAFNNESWIEAMNE